MPTVVVKPEKRQGQFYDPYLATSEHDVSTGWGVFGFQSDAASLFGHTEPRKKESKGGVDIPSKYQQLSDVLTTPSRNDLFNELANVLSDIQKKNLYAYTPFVQPRDVENFEHISIAIKEAHYLRTLQDDWDGEGSPAIASSAIDSAVEFIRVLAQQFFDRLDFIIPQPEFGPSPSGGVTVEWEGQNYKLTLGFPPFMDEKGWFYGRSEMGFKYEGILGSNPKAYLAFFDLFELG